MSLVAYEASSDEESDNDGNEVQTLTLTNHQKSAGPSNIIKHEEENLFSSTSEPVESVLNSTSEPVENVINSTSSIFKKLPVPKSVNVLNIQEEDDEFLHKKATASVAPPKIKKPVQITIPSLSQFKDMEIDSALKSKTTSTSLKQKSCGLLNILPTPKSEMFTKSSNEQSKPTLMNNKVETQAKFIPDSVKNRTTNAFPSNIQTKTKSKPQTMTEIEAESDDGENDFFSLNSKDDLPEVSESEINAMVAKRAAKLAQVSAKLDKTESLVAPLETDENDINTTASQKVDVDEKALHVLVGSRAKRRKMEEVNIVDISSAQVLPNKDEWLRSALASSTTYQPTGTLVDEEPAPGTRRKHQITYLAHQAKANEHELQAMWAANRHTRRQTQSKYGF